MTTLASGSSVTFGLAVDQTFEMTFADGTTGTITVTGPLGSPYRTTFGPAGKNNWKPFPLGLTGRVVLTSTVGVVSYTSGPSSFVTSGTDAVTGEVTGQTVGGPYFLPSNISQRAVKAPLPALGETLSLSDFSILVGTPALSIVTGPNGKPALKIVTNSGEDTSIALNSLVGHTFGGEIYVACDSTYTNGVSNTLVYATPDANYATNYASAGFGGFNGPLNTPAEPSTAPITLRWDKTSLAITGSITYPFTIGAAKLRIIPRASTVVTCYLYGIGLAPQPPKGRIIVTCDDGYDSWFQLGQPVFDNLGIPVTCAVVPSNLNTGAGYAYLRQLKGLVNRDGAVVAHGPNVGGGAGSLFSAFSNTTDRVADMTSVRDWIMTNGLAVPGYEKCYVWPQGLWQQVVSSDRSMLDAAIANGFTCGRSATANTAGVYQNWDGLSAHQHLTFPIIGHTWAGSTAAEATNITNITTAINNAATNGNDVVLMFHRVQPTATGDGSMSSIGIRLGDLTTLANAIAAKVTAGTLATTTLPAVASARNGNFWLNN